MADEPENLVLVYLRRLDAKMDTLIDDVRDVRDRVTRVELAVATVRREQAGDAETVAHLNARLDRVRGDVDRLMRRLDLIEHP